MSTMTNDDNDGEADHDDDKDNEYVLTVKFVWKCFYRKWETKRSLRSMFKNLENVNHM